MSRSAPAARPRRSTARCRPGRRATSRRAREIDFRAQQDYRLIGLPDIHLGEAQDGGAARGNDRTTIATFAIVAALVLATACFNFINLSTASASRRAREVALRKVLGARRQQLVVQFLGESLLVATVAMLIALATVELLLAPYAAFLDADLSISYLGSGGLLLPIIGLVLLIGIAGGLYPAFYLSRFQPGLVLKANRSAAETAGDGPDPHFARHRPILGVDRAHHLHRDHLRANRLRAHRGSRLSERGPDPNRQCKRRPGRSGRRGADARSCAASTASRRWRAPMSASARPATSPSASRCRGRAEPIEISSVPVGPNFFQTMEIDPLAGRLFDENRAADDATRTVPRDPAADRALAARGMNILINARAATALGYSEPRAAVGQQVRAEMLGPDYGPVPLTIVGVVEDSRFRSVRDPIRATMFRQSRGALDWLMVRHSGADAQRVQRAIETAWKRLIPDVPFSAERSENIIADLYAAERARAQIFAAFALLAVLVACMGLFGLAAFTAERRTMEIGIRKVFGASTRDIVRLLVWQFSKPVMIANLIAWPVAWWVMREWLNGFEARIDLGPAPFVIASALALAIAIGTIAGHAFKVARGKSDPCASLRIGER